MSEKPASTLTDCPDGTRRRPVRRTPGARKLTLRIMLGVLGASVLLGLAGKSKAHVVTGLAFSALLADHVWQRRKAL